MLLIHLRSLVTAHASNMIAGVFAGFLEFYIYVDFYKAPR